jgi:radical SAM-linked protein
VEKAYRLCFTKLGPARFLSHMELSSALTRAMIVGGISFVYSQGFHPHPKISFAGATAVGMESEGEFADIRIQDPQEELACLAERINKALPSGMVITAMRELPPRAFSLAELVTGFDYDLILPEELAEEELDRIDRGIRAFQDAESFAVAREVKGKPMLKEIRPFVLTLGLDRGSRRIGLTARIGPEGTIRPAELITGVLGLSDGILHRIRIVKTGTRLANFAGEADREIFFPEAS